MFTAIQTSAKLAALAWSGILAALLFLSFGRAGDATLLEWLPFVAVPIGASALAVWIAVKSRSRPTGLALFAELALLGLAVSAWVILAAASGG
jgi:hypothetical protein